jgi:DNA-directed RNA polymerase subunit beta'
MLVEQETPEVYAILDEVVKEHPVLLNRAPTLHRLGIQAFEPVLVEGRAIKLHPLVCTAFNADFDGDQMAVHVPLSAEAQAEARLLMLAANNLLKPSDGRPVTVPTQDMVLGSYYLTYIRPGATGEGKVFSSINEAQMAYDEGDLDLHAEAIIRMTEEVDGKIITGLVKTSLGRITFNEPIPQNLGFVDRSDPANHFALEVDFLVNKSMLGKLIDRCIRVHGTSLAAEMLDKIKSQGYRFSTRSGITVAVSDAMIPPQKAALIAATEEKILAITKQFNRGFFSNDERAQRTISAWEVCTRQVADALKENFDEYNPINMMLRSGARGTDSQLRQMAGMRGLIANTAGKTIEVPIRANYREGLNILEYFISCRGARKGVADTALRTADSGYLTRRLVDVSQDVIIREHDCGCKEGSEVYDIFADGRKIVNLEERLMGRFLLHDLVDADGGIVQSKDAMMSEEDTVRVAEFVRKNTAAGARATIAIRSLLTCEAEYGVCIKCYGSNLATGEPVTVGEAVGIIAAQSIGEPGTQLTMRTFHTGGAKDQSDITQGLPRVEELFEARKPKLLAIISEISGHVSFREIKKSKNVIITSDDPENAEERAYPIPYDQIIKVADGQHVRKGENITEGARNPHDILAVLGMHDVHDYLIQEVQRTYRMQGVDISDKHIEVIIRQMMRKVKITEPGDAGYLPGTVLDKREFARANAAAVAEKGEEAVAAQCTPVLMGITKASLATESFLSAASFQETTRVLTDAAIKGKVDPLLGLKENVIIGKLLPSGTGMKCYGDVSLFSTQGAFAQKYLEAISGE